MRTERKDKKALKKTMNSPNEKVGTSTSYSYKTVQVLVEPTVKILKQTEFAVEREKNMKIRNGRTAVRFFFALISETRRADKKSADSAPASSFRTHAHASTRAPFQPDTIG